MSKLEEILKKIEEYPRIIVQRHQRPDPDAIGSQCGLVACLRASFPEKEIYQVGGAVEGLEYLATMDEVTDDNYQGALVIVTDTANAPRISDQRYQLGDYLIKVDHHPNDEPYGDLMWVKTEASSCSEMIYDFCSSMDGLQLTDEAARLLYAGIVGDTGRFLYPGTTPHTLEVASQLRQFKFDATHLCRQIEEISFAVAGLSGYVYQHIEADEQGVAKVILPLDIQKKYGVADSQTSAVVSLPGQIEEVKLWGIFVEQPEGYYRVRLRSKGPVINEIAKKHHGGGHPLASGANASNLVEVNEIYQEMQALVQNELIDN